MMDSPKATLWGPGRAGKGLGLGMLGLGAACLGCCLAPLAGVAIAAGTGTGLAAALPGLWMPVLAGVAVLGAIAYLRRRKVACCPDPASGCSTSRCAARPPDSANGGRVS